MSAKTPIRTVFDNSNNATGLAEFQSGEFVALSHGGLGASLSIGSAGQVLKVNSGASALEFGTVEAVFNIDGMTDGTSITVADSDQIAISDGGTEKRINASQLKTYVNTSFGITSLDIDGASDIGAALTTSDLIIVDDGAGGTNRKAALSRINTLVQTAGGFPLTALDIDGGTDIGEALVDADLFIVDNGAGGTNRKTAASRIKTYVADVTLTTAAQTNITSLGTLSALTVDDVAVDGKVITMTGSSSDTAVFTAGTNGTLSIVTTDDSAAAANITITADGTFEADGTTITLDSGGDIVLDADGADVIFKDDGTSILSFTNSSSDAVIIAGVQDKDIIFKGDDGGSAVTSLTLDMSNSGAAVFSAAAYNAEATLTDASTISWNAITQPVAKVTLGGNRTLGAASGGVAGAFVSLLIIQDGTGSRTVSFNAAYEFKDDTAPTLTTTASKGDLFVFRYNGSKWLEVGRNLNLTLS